MKTPTIQPLTPIKKILSHLKKFLKFHKEFQKEVTNENWMAFSNSPYMWINYSIANIPSDEIKDVTNFVLNTESTKYALIKILILSVYEDPDKWLTEDNPLTLKNMLAIHGQPS